MYLYFIRVEFLLHGLHNGNVEAHICPSHVQRAPLLLLLRQCYDCIFYQLAIGRTKTKRTAFFLLLQRSSVSPHRKATYCNVWGRRPFCQTAQLAADVCAPEQPHGTKSCPKDVIMASSALAHQFNRSGNENTDGSWIRAREKIFICRNLQKHRFSCSRCFINSGTNGG